VPFVLLAYFILWLFIYCVALDRPYWNSAIRLLRVPALLGSVRFQKCWDPLQKKKTPLETFEFLAWRGAVRVPPAPADPALSPVPGSFRDMTPDVIRLSRAATHVAHRLAGGTGIAKLQRHTVMGIVMVSLYNSNNKVITWTHHKAGCIDALKRLPNVGSSPSS
jgi:hypothetical protein